MFIYDNGKVFVLSVSRCGHSSMYKYFGFEEYEFEGKISLYTWNEKTNSQRVLVLRNPYDRVVSAINNLKYSLEIHNNKLEISNEEWFYNHSFPYLVKNESKNFKYIDFYKLDSYLGITSKLTLKSSKPPFNSSNVYVKNSYYTKKDLEEEYLSYKRIIKNKEEISVEEWKELTQ